MLFDPPPPVAVTSHQYHSAGWLLVGIFEVENRPLAVLIKADGHVRTQFLDDVYHIEPDLYVKLRLEEELVG